MNKFSNRLIPFISFGIILVVFVAGVVIFSYLLILGALVGLILFALAWLKDKFFPNKYMIKKTERRGRTFDHDEK